MNKNIMVKNSRFSSISTNWHRYKLEDIYNISAGGDFNSNTSSTTRDKINRYPIYANALTNKGLYGYSIHAKHDADSITITARGDIGVANYRKTKFTAIGRLLVLKNKIPVSNKFVCEYINHNVSFLKETTGVPQLTVPQVGKYYILLPSLEEQKKIVEVLSTWDQAIEKMDQLISAKEKQSKWLLKTLITDQQNNLKWPIVKLGEVTEVISGQSPESKHYNQSGKGLPFYQGKVSFTHMYISEPVMWTDKIIKVAEKNDILMSVRAPVGPVNISIEKICIGRGLVAIRTKNLICTKFLFYFLKSISHYITGNGGSVFDSINQKKIKKIKIPLPSLSEQKKITEILFKWEQEIEILKSLSEKYKEQKKGLMQQLLTGKIRLK